MEYRAKGNHVPFRQGLAQVQAAGYAVDIRYVPAVQPADLLTDICLPLREQTHGLLHNS